MSSGSLLLNSLDEFKRILASHGCAKILAKRLSENDNSKNQVYFGGNFELLNILPLGTITAESDGKPHLKATLPFTWLDQTGAIYSAPSAQLILYPQYPEVRFSGFLTGISSEMLAKPNELMRVRLAGRVLFIAVTATHCIGHVCAPDSLLASDFERVIAGRPPDHGVFFEFDTAATSEYQSRLLHALTEVINKGFIAGKRLDGGGTVIDCSSPNACGYTLEAELGIGPNGLPDPDYFGWEVKAYSGTTLTLMTPEPTGGIYKDAGLKDFMLAYGYPDRSGKPDRLNFSSPHYFGKTNVLTGLTLFLPGYDVNSRTLVNPTLSVQLIDRDGRTAASWSYSQLMHHWNRKHERAVYVPVRSAQNGQTKQFAYGPNVFLGIGTDFLKLLHAMAAGKVYYDPGIKLEGISSPKPKPKKRSQFRVRMTDLPALYREFKSWP